MRRHLGYVYLQHTHPRLLYQHTFGVRPGGTVSAAGHRTLI